MKSKRKVETEGEIAMTARGRSKFDEPVMVIWVTKGPLGVEMPANQRHFDTLREAVLHVRAFPHGTRAKMTIQTRIKEYGAAEIEDLEKEMRNR